jgi:hypothetical protein
MSRSQRTADLHHGELSTERFFVKNRPAGNFPHRGTIRALCGLRRIEFIKESAVSEAC